MMLSLIALWDDFANPATLREVTYRHRHQRIHARAMDTGGSRGNVRHRPCPVQRHLGRVAQYRRFLGPERASLGLTFRSWAGATVELGSVRDGCGP